MDLDIVYLGKGSDLGWFEILLDLQLSVVLVDPSDIHFGAIWKREFWVLFEDHSFVID